MAHERANPKKEGPTPTSSLLYSWVRPGPSPSFPFGWAPGFPIHPFLAGPGFPLFWVGALANPDPKGQPRPREGRANPHPEKKANPHPREGRANPNFKPPLLLGQAWPSSSGSGLVLPFLSFWLGPWPSHPPLLGRAWPFPLLGRGPGQPRPEGPTPTQEKEGPTPAPTADPKPQLPIPVLFSSTLGDSCHCVIFI